MSRVHNFVRGRHQRLQLHSHCPCPTTSFSGTWSRRIVRVGADRMNWQQRVPGQNLFPQTQILQVDLGPSDALVVVESDPFLPHHYHDRAPIHFSRLERAMDQVRVMYWDVCKNNSSHLKHKIKQCKIN